MRLAWSADQIQGGRDYQEDFYGALHGNTFQLVKQTRDLSKSLPEGDYLFIMTDGMGGMGHGDEAAAIVLQSFVKYVIHHVPSKGPVGVDELKAALAAANKELGKHVEENPAKRGMGCTIIAAYFSLKHQVVNWLSVGDSPLWKINGAKLVQINEVHNWGNQVHRVHQQQQKRDPSVTLEYIRSLNHPDHLVSAVTGGEINLVDAKSQPIQPGDVFIIASDGMETLSEKEVLSSLAFEAFNPEEASSKMGDAVDSLMARLTANLPQRPNQDNATAIAVAVHDVGGGPMRFIWDAITSTRLASKPEEGKQNTLLKRLLTVVLLLAAVFLSLEIYKTFTSSPSASDSSNPSATTQSPPVIPEQTTSSSLPAKTEDTWPAERQAVPDDEQPEPEKPNRDTAGGSLTDVTAKPPTDAVVPEPVQVSPEGEATSEQLIQQFRRFVEAVELIGSNKPQYAELLGEHKTCGPMTVDFSSERDRMRCWSALVEIVTPGQSIPFTTSTLETISSAYYTKRDRKNDGAGAVLDEKWREYKSGDTRLTGTQIQRLAIDFLKNFPGSQRAKEAETIIVDIRKINNIINEIKTLEANKDYATTDAVMTAEKRLEDWADQGMYQRTSDYGRQSQRLRELREHIEQREARKLADAKLLADFEVALDAARERARATRSLDPISELEEEYADSDNVKIMAGLARLSREREALEAEFADTRAFNLIITEPPTGESLKYAVVFTPTDGGTPLEYRADANELNPINEFDFSIAAGTYRVTLKIVEPQPDQETFDDFEYLHEKSLKEPITIAPDNSGERIPLKFIVRR